MLQSLTTFSRAHPRASAAAVVVAGMAAGLTVWAVVRAMGVDLHVERDGEISTVGAPDVLTASLIAGVGAWAVHSLMASRGRLVRWWPFVASTVLAISMMGPSYFADGADAMALMAMHFAVGVVLIVGLSLRNPRCAPDSSAPAARPTGAPGPVRKPS